MNAIEDNEFHRAWQDLARRLPRPRSILCISAHWETAGVFVTTSKNPETIHDFYGFPEELFDVQYPAPGDPHLAARTLELLSIARARPDSRRGLDHGAWSVLSVMYPAADIPVVQLSLDTRRSGAFHIAVAKLLAPLRDEGVLVVASGNMVHNLASFDFHDPHPLKWAIQCDHEIKRRISAGDHEGLAEYESLGLDATLAVPTPEHYLPLLYPIALQKRDEAVRFLTNVVVSSISMTSFLVGE